VFRRTGPIHTRLPLVASLFLAALLGAPTAPALDPLPAPVTVLAAAPPTTSTTTAIEPTAAEPVPAPPASAPAVEAATVTYPAARVLLDRSGTAAGAPRAPPFSA
jgi:hypothetical protein